MQTDPEAAKVVFDSGVTIVLVNAYLSPLCSLAVA